MKISMRTSKTLTVHYNLTSLTLHKLLVKQSLKTKVQNLTVDLPIDYYGKAELIGITQYVTQLAEKTLNLWINMRFILKMEVSHVRLYVKRKKKSHHKYIFIKTNMNGE